MSFDRLAPFYRAMERIAAGEKMQRCRLAFVESIPTPRRVLLAGEGPGRFLVDCVKRFPQAEIIMIDNSARMLEIAADHESSPQVRFLRADLLEKCPVDGCDLIVTNFFLDCFPPDRLEVVVSNLANAATPGAHWLLADFQVAPGRATGWRSRIILWMLYTFFRVVCGLEARSLVPPENSLEKAGFKLHRRITSEWGLLKSEWWQRG